MMQSEHAGQRNLQQSGAAGQRNTQHATNIKKRSMRRKKARRMRRIKRIFVAAIILAALVSNGLLLYSASICKPSALVAAYPTVIIS